MNIKRFDLEQLVNVQVADVYKKNILAAKLIRSSKGIIFHYLDDYLSDSSNQQVAFTLPLTDQPLLTHGGAVPAFFAGLLPEGRRLSGLRREVKTSLDDELSLLLAVGGDTIGDVSVVPEGHQLGTSQSLINVNQSWSEISFSDVLGEAGIVDPVAIPGIQDKASAQMISLPIKEKHHQYILKINPPEFPYVVENEALFIEIARKCGINVVEANVVYDADGRSGLLVKRFDRGKNEKFGCEDACQILGKWPAEKYTINSEQVALSLSSRCDAKQLAIRDIFRQFCFAWLTGNGDLHAKNLSVLQQDDGEWKLSPSYDIPNTTVYGDRTFALNLGNTKRGLSRKRFLEFANTVGLNLRVAESSMEQLLEQTSDISEIIRNAKLPFPEKTIIDLLAELRNRHRALLGQG